MGERREYFGVKSTTAEREKVHKMSNHSLPLGDGDQPCRKPWQEKLHGEGVIALITEEIPARQYLIQHLQLAG